MFQQTPHFQHMDSHCCRYKGGTLMTYRWGSLGWRYSRSIPPKSAGFSHAGAGRKAVLWVRACGTGSCRCGCV